MATVGVKGLDQGRVYALLTVMKMLFELTRRPQSGVWLLQQLLGTATSVWLANQPLVNQSLGDELPQHWYCQHINTQAYTQKPEKHTYTVSGKKRPPPLNKML